MLRVATVACVLSLTATFAAGKQAPFPEAIEVNGESWEMTGTFHYVYRFFFPLYDVALYAPAGVTKNEILQADVGFQLRFHYLRRIEKSVILKSADKMLAKNLSERTKSSFSEPIETLNRAYRTVEKGDQSSLTFYPDKGTTLRVNGVRKVTVGNKDFAEAYFKIWLGDRPISTQLKTALLSGAET